jgi:hypothetical protein
MFADYLHRRIPPSESTTKLSKIDNSPRYKAIRPRHSSDQDRLVLKPREEHQLTQRLVRFRGIHNLRDSRNSSTKKSARFLLLSLGTKRQRICNGCAESNGELSRRPEGRHLVFELARRDECFSGLESSTRVPPCALNVAKLNQRADAEVAFFANQSKCA